MNIGATTSRKRTNNLHCPNLNSYSTFKRLFTYLVYLSLQLPEKRASNLPQEKCEVAQLLLRNARNALYTYDYISLVCVFHAKFKCKMVLRSITIANTGYYRLTVKCTCFLFQLKQDTNSLVSVTILSSLVIHQNVRVCLHCQ